MRVERPPHQHPRHAGPRRLHRRGRAEPPRPGRRDRALRLRGRGRAAVRDGLAPGRQVPRPADRLRQQDGPHRRGLLQGRRDDARPARRQPAADPDPDRPGGRLRRRRRPDREQGARLEGRAGHRVRLRGHPRGPRGARPRAPHPPDRGLRRLRRRVARGLPERRGDPARADREVAAPRHARHQGDARPLRLLLQEQGRAAAARRDRRAAPLAARGPGRQGARARRRRATTAARPRPSAPPTTALPSPPSPSR